MKRVIFIILVVLVMGCNLATDKDYLEDSWYFYEGDSFTNYEFGEKFVITHIVDGIRGTISYDYCVENDDIYIYRDSSYLRIYHIESVGNNELTLSSYGGEELVFERD